MTPKVVIASLLPMALALTARVSLAESDPTDAQITAAIGRYGPYPKPLVVTMPVGIRSTSWECNVVNSLAELGYLTLVGEPSECKFEVRSTARFFIHTNYDYNYAVIGHSIHLGKIRAEHTHEESNVVRVSEYQYRNAFYDLVVPYLPSNVKAKLSARTYSLTVLKSEEGVVVVAE